MPADTLVQRLLEKDFGSLKEDINNVVQKKLAVKVAEKMKVVRAAVNAAEKKDTK
jgi:hypothetical protein